MNDFYIDVIYIYSLENLWQILQFLLILCVIFFLILVRQRLLLQKRVAPYIVEKQNKEHSSVVESWRRGYLILIQIVDDLLLRVIKNTEISYFQRYLGTINHSYQNAISFISEKILLLLLFFLINVFLQLVIWQLLAVYILMIIFIELVNYWRYSNYRKIIINEFAQIITYMNNGFRSGKSIIQVIDLLAQKDNLILSREFKIMQQEINWGMSVEEAFQRFAQRINIRDARTLVVLMHILNQAGGHINELFTAMQKRLYNKKEILLEVEAVTGGLKLISVILGVMPFAIVGTLYLLNPTYFDPLMTNFIGRLIILIVLNLYIVYVLIIKKLFMVVE